VTVLALLAAISPILQGRPGFLCPLPSMPLY